MGELGTDDDKMPVVLRHFVQNYANTDAAPASRAKWLVVGEPKPYKDNALIDKWIHAFVVLHFGASSSEYEPMRLVPSEDGDLERMPKKVGNCSNVVIDFHIPACIAGCCAKTEKQMSSQVPVNPLQNGKEAADASPEMNDGAKAARSSSNILKVKKGTAVKNPLSLKNGQDEMSNNAERIMTSDRSSVRGSLAKEPLLDILARIRDNDPTCDEFALDNQKLREKGAAKLAEALKKNRHVQIVKLRGHEIKDEGAEALDH